MTLDDMIKSLNDDTVWEIEIKSGQLAEWLTELKELRRLVDLVAKYAGKSEDICERYLPSIDGDLCVTDGMGASNCTCCGYEYRCDYKTDIGLLEDVETSTNADVQPVISGDNCIVCGRNVHKDDVYYDVNGGTICEACMNTKCKCKNGR
jgi:hypothetical protein